MYYLDEDIYAPYPARIIIDRFHASQAPPCGEFHMRDNRAARLSPDDYFVLSGILTEKAPEVVEAFVRDISFVKETTEGEWSCLLFSEFEQPDSY